MKKVLLVLLCMFASLAYSQESDFTWITNTVGGVTNITLTSWKTNSYYVTIPDVITNSTPPNLPVVSFGSIFNTTTNMLYKPDLISLIIGNNITNIDSDAVRNILSLTHLTIGNSVRSIGTNAFVGCIHLTDINIPNSVTEIKWGAFKTCHAVTNLTLGSGSNLTIASSAFAYCNKLTDIYIPNNVGNFTASWAGTPFVSCHNITNFAVHPNNNYYSSVDGILFDKTPPYTLIQFPAGRTGSVSFANNNIDVLGEYSMSYTLLSSITLPTNVITVKGKAFLGSEYLNSINFKGNAPTFGSYCFVTEIGMTNTIPATIYITRNSTGWPTPPNTIPQTAGSGIPVRYMEIMLTVSNGSGSGIYTNGTVTNVNICATNIPHKTFKHWIGDTQYIANTNSLSTYVILPDLNIDINIEASYYNNVIKIYGVDNYSTINGIPINQIRSIGGVVY